MSKLSWALAVVAVTFVAAPAEAYTVKSSVECPDVLREHTNENFRLMNQWWLMGYFTARNFVDDARVGAEPLPAAIYEIARAYCEANPERDWDDAAQHAYERLR